MEPISISISVVRPAIVARMKACMDDFGTMVEEGNYEITQDARIEAQEGEYIYSNGGSNFSSYSFRLMQEMLSKLKKLEDEGWLSVTVDNLCGDNKTAKIQCLKALITYGVRHNYKERFFEELITILL